MVLKFIHYCFIKVVKSLKCSLLEPADSLLIQRLLVAGEQKGAMGFGSDCRVPSFCSNTNLGLGTELWTPDVLIFVIVESLTLINSLIRPTQIHFSEVWGSGISFIFWIIKYEPFLLHTLRSYVIHTNIWWPHQMLIWTLWFIIWTHTLNMKSTNVLCTALPIKLYVYYLKFDFNEVFVIFSISLILKSLANYFEDV